MLTHFPQAVPEIPVSNVDRAAEYYVNVLGFSFDWGNDAGGIGGISQGDCRMFLTNAPFRAGHGPNGPIIVWLNLNSKQEVDELFERWKDTGAKIVEPVEDKPWKLRHGAQRFRATRGVNCGHEHLHAPHQWPNTSNRRRAQRQPVVGTPLRAGSNWIQVRMW